MINKVRTSYSVDLVVSKELMQQRRGTIIINNPTVHEKSNSINQCVYLTISYNFK